MRPRAFQSAMHPALVGIATMIKLQMRLLAWDELLQMQLILLPNSGIKASNRQDVSPELPQHQTRSAQSSASNGLQSEE